MKYVMTNARMIDDVLFTCDIIDANKRVCAYVFLGTHNKRAEVAQWDAPMPHAVASRAFAGQRALRHLSHSSAFRAFLTHGMLDASRCVALPAIVNAK